MRQPIPFGKYLLLDRVSVGGMAEVFKAKSYGVEGFEKVIAIKRILPSMGEDKDFIKMFIDEAKIAGQLAHANICQIFELGRIEGSHFIAMEYIWGKDLLQLQNRFRKRGQIMPVAMACYIVAKVCEGLDYAHRKRDAMGRALEIVHRDCSPQNVLISYEGEVKIIDFGIAKAASRSSRTMAGVLKGKFGYMSPEQVRGLPLDRRTDIFALGTVLYESLTGARLFQGESDFSTLEKVRNVAIDPPSSVNRSIPPEVEDIVMRALAREPDERYQWCGEMHTDLQRYMMMQPNVFSAKSLATWMKDAFRDELLNEREAMERYKRVGRDGLIAGMPQAEVRLDVVEHLGEAGTSDDPTMLGGPSFDDIIRDNPELLQAGHQAGGGDFEEKPTELFGEVSEISEELSIVDVIAMHDANSSEETIRPPVSGEAPRNFHVPQSSQEPTVMLAEDLTPPPLGAQHGTPSPKPLGSEAITMMTPSGLAALEADAANNPLALGSNPRMQQHLPPHMMDSNSQVQALPESGPGVEEASYTGTSSVTPLPSPADAVSLGELSKNRKRPSIAKDVAIGVGIAAAVLGVFIGIKYLFFGDKPGTREAQASEVGTIVVTASVSVPAEVLLDGKKMGVVSAGRALTLGDKAVGKHRVEVTAAGMLPCRHRFKLTASKPEVIQCQLKPAIGKLILTGIEEGHSVEVDGKPTPKPAEPISLPVGVEHTVVVKKGDKVLNKFGLSVEKGQEITQPAVPVTKAVAAKKRDKDEDKKSRKRDRDRTGSSHPAKAPRSVAPRPSKKPLEKKQAKGYFMAYTSPWAKIYINGRFTGKSTPIARRAKIPLKPGTYRVTFEAQGQKFTYPVTIKSGEDTKLVKDLPVKN